MERYRVRASLNLNNSNFSQRSSSFPSKPCSQISPPPKPPISSYLGRRVINDTEISIFDAERYFNEGLIPKKSTIILNGISTTTADSCESLTNPRDSSVSSVDGYGRNWRSRSFRATPTASSEASWNSQSGLLSKPLNSVAVSVRAFPLNEKSKGSSHSFSVGRRFFGRNCPCYGKKSVDVEGKYAEPPKSPVRFSSDKVSTVTSVTSTTIDSSVTKEVEEVAKLKISAGVWTTDSELFSPEKPFPAEIGHRILNSGRSFAESTGFSFPILAPRKPVMAAGDDPARDSLEVFRPSDELAKLRRSAEFPRLTPAAGAGDDDVESDTSSDLFEIESFSTHLAYRRHDSLDEFQKLTGNAAAEAAGTLQFWRNLEETPASMAPSECYAPSEVSVEWSVTTAEGGFDRASVANFSSTASDYDEARFIHTEHDRFGAAMMAGNGGGCGKRKGTGGGLLSCRSENSVNVGPSPVWIKPEQRRTGAVVFAGEPDPGLGGSRFALEKGELVHSHSARLNRAVQTR